MGGEDTAREEGAGAEDDPPSGPAGEDRRGTLATAPGKVILMGEHAVVYGRPALIAAVDLRARARLRPEESAAPGRLLLELPDVDHRERLPLREAREYARTVRAAWRRYRDAGDRRSFADVRGEDPAHLVKVALGEALRRVDGEGGPGLALEVRSEVPIGRGFGSSAAVGAAVVLASLAHHRADLSPREEESLLLDVERRQHGDPSGVDSATVLGGGLVWADQGEGADGLRTRSCSPGSDVLRELHLFDTGPPAQETGEVVAAVRELREREPESVEGTLGEMGRTTVRFRRLVTAPDPDRGEVVAAIRRYQRGLEELGVVPEPVRQLVRRVESEGGAAKISGAGALSSPPGDEPGGGLLLVYHPDRERVSRWPFLSELPRFGVRFGAAGARVESER